MRFCRMEFLWMILTLCALVKTNPADVITNGPPTGIVLRDDPGLLITNCRVHTQRVYVRLDAENVYRQHIPPAAHLSWAGADWTSQAIKHAQLDTAHMLAQLQKFTVTQSELAEPRREKRFVGALLSIGAAVGSLFALGTTAVNAVSLATVKRNVREITEEMPLIQQQMKAQALRLQHVGKSLQDTILVVNTHATLLNKTILSVGKLAEVMNHDYAHVQLVRLLLEDFLREVSSSMDHLAMNRIPSYLVPLSMVHDILTSATSTTIRPLQSHLAYSLGSAIPIHVDVDRNEVGFLLTLPVVELENIYRLKTVLNVGFWRDSTHVKIATPPVVAYQENNPDFYLTPNLLMCTLTKDVHYLCPSKPFVRDNTERLCGIKAITSEERCRAKLTARDGATTTQVEVVGNRWLVNTPFASATMTYERHDSITQLNLPNQTVFVTVPEGAIIHVDDLALYRLPDDRIDTEIEMPDAFAKRSLELPQAIQYQIQYEGPMTVDLSVLDEALLVDPTDYRPKDWSVARSWTVPDSILTVTMILGLISLGVCTYYVHRRTRAMEDLMRSYTRITRGTEAIPIFGKLAMDPETLLQGPVPASSPELARSAQ